MVIVTRLYSFPVLFLAFIGLTQGCVGMEAEPEFAKSVADNSVLACGQDLPGKLAQELNRGYLPVLKDGLWSFHDWKLESSLGERVSQLLDPSSLFGGDAVVGKVSVTHSKEGIVADLLAPPAVSIGVTMNMGNDGEFVRRTIVASFVVTLPATLDGHRLSSDKRIHVLSASVAAYAISHQGVLNGLWHCDGGRFVANHALAHASMEAIDLGGSSANEWKLVVPGEVSGLGGIDLFLGRSGRVDRRVTSLEFSTSEQSVSGNVLFSMKSFKRLQDVTRLDLNGRPIEGSFSLDAPSALRELSFGRSSSGDEILIDGPCADGLTTVDVSGVVVDDYHAFFDCASLESLVAGPQVGRFFSDPGMDSAEEINLLNQAKDRWNVDLKIERRSSK